MNEWFLVEDLCEPLDGHGGEHACSCYLLEFLVHLLYCFNGFCECLEGHADELVQWRVCCFGN